MVLTRSMMKTQVRHPIVVMPLSVPSSKHVLSFKEIKEQPAQALQPVQIVQALKPAVQPIINSSNWPYYAMFVPAFVYCAYYRSASGLVWVSLLSQMVHYMVRK